MTGSSKAANARQGLWLCAEGARSSTQVSAQALWSLWWEGKNELQEEFRC